MDGNILERCVVTTVAEMLRDKKTMFKTEKEFAFAAFPKESDPPSLWKHLKNGQKGKPRNLQLAHAHGMAEALGIPLTKLLTMAELRIEAGWTCEQDTFNDLEAKKPGRKKTKGAPASTKQPVQPVSTGSAN